MPQSHLGSAATFNRGDAAMSATSAENSQGTCFVVMGFGKKTDFETGRTLDLDKSYRNIIKPAVEAAGLRCIRADEIIHSGLIDVPMYEQLLNADVVVADLSTSNKNAFYELGVRHALRPYTTVVIAEDGIKTFPFDVNHVVVRQYHHLGEDIGFDEVMRFRELLTKAIQEIMSQNPRSSDSPVYTFINGLNPPAVARAIAEAKAGANSAVTAEKALMDASGGEAKEPASEAAKAATAMSRSMLMEQVDEAQKREDFVAAKNLLSFIRGMMKQEAPDRPEDPYIIQRLAFLTYKSEYPSKEAALKEARDLLETLEPKTSNDTETLGLWGAVHKRLWGLTKANDALNEAVRGYERGYFLRNDYYNGINLAYLLNVRAANAEDPAEAIADFIQARRIRQEVKAICDEWLKSHPPPDAGNASAKGMLEYQKSSYWVMASMAEAHIGLGEEEEAERLLEQAYASAPDSWMKTSTQEQITELKRMLSDSPLKYLKAEKQ
jgi:hypothetical protein